MTVRFAARIAIAIATLLGSAALCWGQPPGTRFGNAAGNQSAAPTVRRASSVAPVEPSAGGTWVADEDQNKVLEIPFHGSDAGGAPPVDDMPGVYDSGDGSGGEMEGGDGSCQCEECSGQNGGDPGRHGHGGLGKYLVFTDLWTEVHSHRRTWVAVDYLSMWAKGNQVPALVTTSPLGTPQAEVGRLPVSATTSILYGDDRVDLNQRNGARINVGYWLVDGEFWGVEGQYFALQPQNTPFRETSIFSDGIHADDQYLARPFFNVDPNPPGPRQDALIVAMNDFVLAGSQGPLDGTVDVKTTSNVQSAGALLRKLVWIDFTKQCRVDFLFGYRFFRTDDSVIIQDESTFTPQSGPLPGPITFRGEDIFSAKNIFNGGELGFKYQHYCGPLSLELIGKCAFGNNHQNMYINGSTEVIIDGVPPTTFVGDLLTQPTNIGTYKRDVFAVLPEANVNLRFDITRNLRATMGYTYIYTNRTQRSGDAIDINVNPTQIQGGVLDGPAQPAFAFRDTPFWVHGVSAGLEYRW
jgi:hypothetical protein